MSENKNPYGVGIFSGGWLFVVALSILGIFCGLYAYSLQFFKGEYVTGMRNLGTMGGATWGLYIVFVVYFIGVSFAGISIAAMVRIFDLKKLQPITRMAELLTIVSLILGTFCILVDVGQPLRALINLPKYARPQSPFFGTFTLVVSGYLFASLVYFYLASRKDAYLMYQQGSSLSWLYKLWAAGYQDTPLEKARHHRTSFWLAIAILPLLVTAHSTLGFIFGLQVGRPGWHSAIQAPGFVILAGASGVGLLIIIAFMLRRISKLREELNDEIFQWLGKFMLALLVIYLYFMVVEILTAVYTGAHHEREVMYVLLKGEFAKIFWGAIFCLALPTILIFFQWIFKRYNKYVLFFSALLVNIGAILKRYAIVVPSQTHGTMLPYESGVYSPTWVEYGILLGITSFGIFLYLLFIKIFPILDLKKEEEMAEEKTIAPIEFGRVGFCLLLVVLGFVLQFVSYFYLSAPIGIPTSEIYSNPKVPFAPVIFILGVMLVFIGAVLYEILPGKKGQLQNA